MSESHVVSSSSTPLPSDLLELHAALLKHVSENSIESPSAQARPKERLQVKPLPVSTKLSPRASIHSPLEQLKINVEAPTPRGLISPSRHLATAAHLKDVHIDLKFSNIEEVKPVKLYNFPTAPGAIANPLSSTPGKETLMRDPHGTTIPLESWSAEGRGFHDYSQGIATAAERRRREANEREQARQAQAWENHLQLLRESHAGEDVLALMKDSVERARDKRKQEKAELRQPQKGHLHAYDTLSLGQDHHPSQPNSPRSQTQPQHQQLLSPNAKSNRDAANQQHMSPSQSISTGSATGATPRRPTLAIEGLDTSLTDEEHAGTPTSGAKSSTAKKNKRASSDALRDSGIQSNNLSAMQLSSNEQPIPLRLSHYKQRLEHSAIQAKRDSYLSLRPTNPFTQMDTLAKSKVAFTDDPALGYESIMSRQHFDSVEAAKHLQKQKERHAQQLEEERQRLGLDEDEMALLRSKDNADDAMLHIAGVDPTMYKPSAHFSRETKDLLSNPYYTNPSPTGDMSLPLSAAAVSGADPSDYLRKNRQAPESQKTIQAIQQRMSNNIIHSFLSHTQELSEGGLGRLHAPAAAGGLAGKVDVFKNLVDQIKYTGVLESGSAEERAQSEIFQGHPSTLVNLNKLRKAEKAGLSIGLNLPGSRSRLHANKTVENEMQRQMEYQRFIGNSHSMHNLSQIHATAKALRLSEDLDDESGELARTSRSFPYAVKIKFRSRRIRVNKLHLSYFFATIPGVTKLHTILLSPDLQEAYISFDYNRFLHASAGAEASKDVTGGRSGVECDGVQAVRMHMRIICAETPTAYLATHKSAADTKALLAEHGVAAMDDAAHKEMLVLLRFLLLKAHVTEFSEVQLQALKNKWNSSHTLPHVANPDTLRPTETLPERKESSSEENSNSNNNNAEKATLSSEDRMAKIAENVVNQLTAQPAVSLMSQDTAHMFSPRTGTSLVAKPQQQVHTFGGVKGQVGPTAAGKSRPRRNKVNKELIPQLQWPEGMFAHVNHAQSQAAYLAQTSGVGAGGMNGVNGKSSASSNNGSQSARIPTPPLPSNFLGPALSNTSRRTASHTARLTAVAQAVGSQQLSYPAPPASLSHGGIAMPDPGTGTGMPPASLATAPTAPPPLSQAVISHIETRGGTAVVMRRRELVSAYDFARREPSVYTKHPSSHGAARQSDPTVHVAAQSKFFHSEGDLSNLRVTKTNLSGPAPRMAADEAEFGSYEMARAIDVQVTSQEAKEEQRRADAFKQSKAAPVRDSEGRITAATKRRMNSHAKVADRGRITSNLGWTLTAQLEGAEKY